MRGLIELSFVDSADPALWLLRSSSHEVFESPFAGYALLLFGAADEGVAKWFADSLISIDSLTGKDVACFILAKKIQLRATVTRYGNQPSGPAKIDNVTGAYDLSTIHRVNCPANQTDRGFSYRPLVHEAVPQWRPSDEEIKVTTYEVDRVATELSVTDRLPCIVFFDAVLSSTPTLKDVKSHRIAVFPIRDKPGPEVIRFLRRVLHRFRNFIGYERYLSTLKEFVEYERQANIHLWNYVKPLQREIEQMTENHRLRIERLAAFKSELPGLIGRASFKRLKQLRPTTPEIPAEAVEIIKTKMVIARHKLMAINKAVSALEHQIDVDTWPLSELSRNQLLQAVSDPQLRALLPDLDPSGVVISRLACNEMLERLRTKQATLVGAILDTGPDIDEMIERLNREFNASVGVLQLKLRDRELALAQISRPLEVARSYCESEERPSLVAAVLAELKDAREETGGESAQRDTSPLLIFLMQNGGDTYISGQAGAVGPGAIASNMTFAAERIPLAKSPAKTPSRGSDN